MALLAHHSGTYLAQTYAVSPTLTMQNETIVGFLYIKGR